MKISIDLGALCGPRLGNFIFTENLIKALINYDKKNTYYLYSFCDKPKNLLLPKNFIYKKLIPKYKWIDLRMSYEELVNKSDIFLALNQAIPKTKATVISFSHGLSFVKYKNLYLVDYLRLKNQLDNMIKKSKYIIVSSEKVKKEIINYGASKNQVKTLNFGIPLDFLKIEKKNTKKYFLYVGSCHSIKNIKFIIEAFTSFTQFHKEYKLILVLDSYIRSVNKNIQIKTNISRTSLKKLYSNATAYLSASYYESFNIPILEALSQKCPVIALKSSVIPELQKYTNLVKNKNDFINLMKKSVDKKLKINDLSLLKKEFSWNIYVKELCKLY